MTRIVSTPIVQGSTAQDVDPGAITFEREIQDAIGDFNFVDDYLSGNNSPSVTHYHAGLTTGCPLGIPMSGGGQVFSLDDNTGNGGGIERIVKGSSSYVTPLCVTGHHVYLMPGESTLAVGFDATRFQPNLGAFTLRAYCVEHDQIMNLADVDLVDLEMSDGFYFAEFTSLLPGDEYIIGIAIAATQNLGVAVSPSGAFERPRTSVFFNRRAPQTSRVYQGQLRSNTSPPEVPVVATGTGGQLGARPLPQDGVVFPGVRIGNVFPKLLSRAQNVLTEELTGFPAGADDGGLTLSDTTSGTDYRAFHDHSAKTGKASEDAVKMPLFSDSLGCFYASGAVDIGEDYGSAPSVFQYSGSTPGVDIVRVARLTPIPDVSLSSMRAVCMIYKPSGTTTPTATVEFDTTFGPGSGTSTTSMTVTRIGTTNWWRGSAFAPATAVRGDINRAILSVKNNVSGNLSVATFSAWLE